MRNASSSDIVLERLMKLHPKVMDLVLDRVWRLLDNMGNPQNDVPPVIHIAGTNGKGSTLAMLRAGLEGDGKRVHGYTSPHLVRFHERIRLAGELIDEQALLKLLEDCERANGGDQITFFEITTVAALVAFARTPADYTLLEVGLGGRLDATNVVDRPALTVITPVSIDHQQFLGDTILQIAGEKAGILKRGVPCIVGPQTDEGLEVIEEQASRVGAPLKIYGQDWTVHSEHGRLVYQDDDGLLDLDPPRLAGAHQIQNAGVAIAGLRLLGLPEPSIQKALTQAEWPARIQRLSSGALNDLLPPDAELWLDGGHNASAGEAIASVMDDWHQRHPLPVHMICGMLETKSAADFLAPMLPRVASLRCIAIPDAPATFSAEALADIAGQDACAVSDVETALRQIRDEANGPCRVMICGSLYLAGHVLQIHG